MKTRYFLLAAGLLCAAGTRAQWTADKTYYIQTKEGLCLGNQGTGDELALVRMATPDAQDENLKWTLAPAGDGYVITNAGSRKAVDNVGSKYLNLFQTTTEGTPGGNSLWTLRPVPGKDGYYHVVSANYPAMQWQANYNGTVCIADSSRYTTAQWFRINETIQEPDNVTQPDVEPVYTPGVTEVEFSTEDEPVWYTLNCYYANSPTAQKANLIAYYETANSRWIVKGASNTKATDESFSVPDCSLWRLEGSESSFTLVNKGTGLKLTNPQNVSQQQRYTLGKQGSTYKLGRADGLSADMQPDAFYLEATDAAVAGKGRVHCDGATVELILFKNGTADVVGGKGSALIFMKHEMKQVNVRSNNEALGTAAILKDCEATAFADNVFTFTYPEDAETASAVTRSAAGKVKLLATAAQGGEFLGWYVADKDELLSGKAEYTCDETGDISVEARFAPATGIEKNVADNGQCRLDGHTLTAPEGTTSIQVYSADGRCVCRATGNRASIAALPHGAYIVKTRRAGAEHTTRIIR